MRTLAASGRLYLPQRKTSLLQPGGWWRRPSSHRSPWAGLSLGLTLLLAYGLTEGGYTTGHPFRPDDLKEEPAPLDSFSEPAVACAILRQEAERLLMVYRDNPHLEPASQAPPKPVGWEPDAQPGTRQSTHPPTASGKRSRPQAGFLQSLSVLDAQVQDVRRNLDGKLLLVYLEQHMWSEFVDRYLELVGEGAARREVVLYVRCALACSQKCGRAEEVVDVLQHVVRFHPELNTAGELKSVLADWKTASLRDAEVLR